MDDDLFILVNFHVHLVGRQRVRELLQVHQRRKVLQLNRWTVIFHESNDYKLLESSIITQLNKDFYALRAFTLRIAFRYIFELSKI